MVGFQSQQDVFSYYRDDKYNINSYGGEGIVLDLAPCIYWTTK